MSFKINTVRNKRNSVKPLTETESLAENIDEKSVKIQNNGNDYFFYKLSKNQTKSIGVVSNSKIVFDEEQNKWILIKD